VNGGGCPDASQIYTSVISWDNTRAIYSIILPWIIIVTNGALGFQKNQTRRGRGGDWVAWQGNTETYLVYEKWW